MKCQKCGKYEANTHITETINGVKNEIFLCKNCAQSTVQHPGIESIFKNNFDNFFAPFWSGPKASYIQAAAPVMCSNCKSTIADIQKNGRLGCSECYKTFADLLPLKNIHGSNNHTGKTPKRAINYSKTEQLRQELCEAVESQNFERAAELRDKIREMEA